MQYLKQRRKKKKRASKQTTNHLKNGCLNDANVFSFTFVNNNDNGMLCKTKTKKIHHNYIVNVMHIHMILWFYSKRQHITSLYIHFCIFLAEINVVAIICLIFNQTFSVEFEIVHSEDSGLKALWSKLLFLANIFILKLRARIIAMAMNATHQAAAWFVLIDYLYPLNIIIITLFFNSISQCIVLCCCLRERASFPWALTQMFWNISSLSLSVSLSIYLSVFTVWSIHGSDQLISIFMLMHPIKNHHQQCPFDGCVVCCYSCYSCYFCYSYHDSCSLRLKYSDQMNCIWFEIVVLNLCPLCHTPKTIAM